MRPIWTEVWVILAERCRTLGFMRDYGPSRADGISAWVRFGGDQAGESC